jgi:hypothetical protein
MYFVWLNASGIAQPHHCHPGLSGPRGAAVDGFDQACRFLASLGLPFALHEYANEETAHEAPRLASAEF